MITTTALFDARVTIGTVFGVGRDIVGRLPVLLTLGQPLSDHMTTGGSVIFETALEAELCLTAATVHSLRFRIGGSKYSTAAVGFVGAEAQKRVRADKIAEHEASVAAMRQKAV